MREGGVCSDRDVDVDDRQAVVGGKCRARVVLRAAQRGYYDGDAFARETVYVRMAHDGDRKFHTSLLMLR
jgi:hypothetical protein